MLTPRSLTLLKVNMVSNARMKVHTKVKECMHEFVCVKTAELPGKGTFIFINPDYSVEEGRSVGLSNFLTAPREQTHQRLPGSPKGPFCHLPRPLGVQGCPVCTSLGHPFFVPSPQAGAKQQLAVTTAIVGPSSGWSEFSAAGT